MQTANISLSEETWTLIDLYREGTGLGRSAAIEVLVGCALTQGLVMPQARADGECPTADPVVGDDTSFDEPGLDFDVDDADPAAAGVSGPEADAPDGGEEATGSSTPASSGGSSEHSPDA